MDHIFFGLFQPIEPSLLLPSQSAKGMVQWAGTARKRYDPLRDITTEEWGEQWPTYLSAELVREVLNESGRLIRYTMVTYGEGSPGKAKQQDAENFIEMHTAHVAQMERAIFIIDRMLRQVAFQQVSQDAKKLARKVERLTEQNIEEMSASEIFAKLNPIDRLMTDLKKESSELGEGSIKEFIENRSDESLNLEQELRKSIEAGDIEEARQLMEQLAESLQQFSDGLQEQMERMRQEENELMEQLENLIKDLEKIEEEQLSLADELSDAREEESSEVQQIAAPVSYTHLTLPTKA